MLEVSDAVIIAVSSGLASGLVSWGGVRADLKALRRDIEQVQKDADRANGRIDTILAMQPFNRRISDKE